MKNKKYFVLMYTKNWMFKLNCKSFRLANWLMNLKIWKYAKIHDMEDEHKCIAFIKR